MLLIINHRSLYAVSSRLDARSTLQIHYAAAVTWLTVAVTLCSNSTDAGVGSGRRDKAIRHGTFH